MPNRVNKLYLKNFNWELNLLGGQTFSWKYEKDAYIGSTMDKIVILKPLDDYVLWQTYPENDDWEFLENYFRLKTDYDHILSEVLKDNHVLLANSVVPGIRLLKQEFKQTLISFLASPRKNIKSIRTSIRKMTEALGPDIRIPGLGKQYMFPSMETISKNSISRLSEFGFGYRSRSIKEASVVLCTKNYEKVLTDPDHEVVERYLKSFYGVGDKITDCVMVYSLGSDSITPLDVWGMRILSEIYKVDKNLRYSEMSNYMSGLFGKYTSWAGQILFE
jgi:N-glycosylase/DNA lyase